MKGLHIFFFFGLIFTNLSAQEKYKLTNKEGKTVEVELIAIEEKKLVAKTAKSAITNIPLDTLSDKDQEYLKTWWEKNRNKPTAMDIRVSVEKKTDRIDRKVTRTQGGCNPQQGQQIPQIVNKQTIDEFYFIGKLDNYSRKEIDEIDVEYTIYKRISKDDGKESDTKVEEIRGTDTIRSLVAKGSGEFETDKVKCEDTSISGGNQNRKYKRETILGVVFAFRTASGEFLRYGYPDGFLERADEIE